eukprot:TRINITY_DN7979_c0_g1_i5.p1 TRINITY_DN7979_c0_g1~~TRINITY_DN7979_c0_g1_i5.p1  ORF type:complete len:126 (-),score=16.79 TRINITY_DN7979_c0_g1_i5:309-686(-)
MDSQRRSSQQLLEVGMSPTVQEVLNRYDEFYKSPSEEAKRGFRRGNHIWTEAEKKRYEEAFIKYYGNQMCNKKIAAHVGNGVSPQQCTEYRSRLKSSGKLDALIEEGIKSLEERRLRWKKRRGLA